MFVLHLALVGFFVLALGPQAVLSHFDSISFSTVQQCGNFTIQFSGGELPATLPLTLTIVPFNSTPISIVLPASAWDSTTATGAAVNFLPLAEGVQFVASLDDARGVGTGLVSDVIQVQPSNNSACLHQFNMTRHFLIDNDLMQCAPFNVSFNQAVDHAPTIRGFVPRGTSFLVNRTLPANQSGIASYIMDVFRDSQTALLLSDNSTDYKETTGLLAVGGNSMSSNSCIPVFVPAANTTATSMEAIKSTSKRLSKGDIIAIAVVPGTIALAIVIVIAVYLHRRRKARASRMANMENGSWEIVDSPDAGKPPGNAVATYPILESPTGWSRKGSLSPSTPTFDSHEPEPERVTDGDGGGYLKNPLYTDPKLSFVSATILSASNSTTGSMAWSMQGSDYSARASLAPSAPFAVALPSSPKAYCNSNSVKRSLSRRRSSRSRVMPTSPTSSISTTDIEHILDMATMYSSELFENANLPLRPPPVLVQDTARTSAYLAGRQSVPVSFSFSVERDSLQQPTGPPTQHATGPSPLTREAVGSVSSPVCSTPIISVESSRAGSSQAYREPYREPPTAPLPSSPLPPASPLRSPLPGTLRPPRDVDGDLRLSAASSAMYSGDFTPETLQSFELVSPLGNAQRESSQI